MNQGEKKWMAVISTINPEFDGFKCYAVSLDFLTEPEKGNVFSAMNLSVNKHDGYFMLLTVLTSS